jgi:type I restriction enzyme S subunit
MNELKRIKLPLPKPKEQKKIAAFLGVVDAKIAALRARRDGLERYKRGLMQALFSQTLRFTKPDGTVFPDWEEKRLGDVLHEHKLKSTGTEQVFSVSVHKGLVNQIEHLGRSFSAANTDHYNRVKQHDIVYTKSPTGDFPLGVIKQSDIVEDVIVSPLYGVFTPETPALGRILHVHFESPVNVSNYLSSIVQKGAKNTINVTNAGFLSNKLRLPVSHEEQQKIADALSAMDAKIAAVADQVTQMEAFKKGLLQQMFV